MHGQVSLPALQEPPQALRDLLSHDVARAKQFRQQIRAYNCSLQLASSTLKDSPQPDTDYIPVPERLLTPSQQPSDLIAAVFGDLAQYQGDGLDLVDRAILTPLNEMVDSLNNECMSRFPGEERCYLSVDSVRDPDHATLYPVEFLNTLTTAGLPPHELRLKKGADAAPNAPRCSGQ
ncbi:hypothetical protein ABPG75_012263 [Micractinium tetrahymenae]